MTKYLQLDKVVLQLKSGSDFNDLDNAILTGATCLLESKLIVIFKDAGTHLIALIGSIVADRRIKTATNVYLFI